ncbi:Fur family transcriptional regulator [Variovorax ginsengisoli]|uniref:Fur family ferric uptake transcriptional regulator n=1 Tax=Variovorax ginsengisoli TaxID=363844 RepID=A0ABT9S1J6_9BURK|nr:transcriptional repressor [Variovorax ginsengisoli]MDP9898224.1 Fur family ferric uptake transcriptional regulator [Variovorax ginsengisoli]
MTASAKPFASDPSETPALLRAKGLRVTRASVTVMNLLRQATHPLTHEEIGAAFAAATGESVDRVTLYRVLDRLVESRLCQRRVGDDRVTRFSQVVDAPSGHVFECDHCHTQLALPADPELPKVIGRLGQALRAKGIDPDCTAVTLHGICGACNVR